MSATVSTDFLLQVAQATPEQQAAIRRILAGEALPQPPATTAGTAELPPANQFVRQGKLWKVVFNGGAPFYLPDMLGARYLDYLLRHPNEPISAFGLEVAITAEKGEARSRNTVQPESDSRAKREYQRALRRSQARREAAQAAGDREEVERLDYEIGSLRSALGEGRGADDTGERARNNVRHALGKLRATLRMGGREEKEFAAHLHDSLSTGYDCMYSQPEGRVWG